jgi:hypothetical protein
MARFPKLKGLKGSLKWTQLVVNECPELINMPLREACHLPLDTEISWLSPISSDEFAEYRDEAFLERLRTRLEKRPLKMFWPSRGPQWDALGRSRGGEVFLVESKAHVAEMLSPGTRALGKSKLFIEKSLKETQSFLGVDPGIDWSAVLYQYTNRLAHLYLLRELNRVPAYLVFMYFVGDREMGSPSTKEEWKSAAQVVRGVLGLRTSHKLSRHIVDVFIDVTEIK